MTAVWKVRLCLFLLPCRHIQRCLQWWLKLEITLSVRLGRRRGRRRVKAGAAWSPAALSGSEARWPACHWRRCVCVCVCVWERGESGAAVAWHFRSWTRPRRMGWQASEGADAITASTVVAAAANTLLQCPCLCQDSRICRQKWDSTALASWGWFAPHTHTYSPSPQLSPQIKEVN